MEAATCSRVTGGRGQYWHLKGRGGSCHLSPLVCASAAGRRHNPRGVWDEGSEGEISPKGRATQGLLMKHDALRRENGRLRALDLKPGVRGRASQGRICLLQPKADGAGGPAGGPHGGARGGPGGQQQAHKWSTTGAQGWQRPRSGAFSGFHGAGLPSKADSPRVTVASLNEMETRAGCFLSMRGFRTSRLP